MNEWHKSSYSSTGGQCVEVREHAAGADIRDTQNRDLGYLTVPGPEWMALLTRVRAER
ncbi:DUF397 domain-containing protein [Nocardiopsis sp. YSL2]|uniref:DUF397 domain-containing protein n=1 Tax=Nocardiopsis sp. YSL2 TaxID=2939492 RepID=UPI0026F41C49|nr:DUF397 domain-containing protein [Nocardiopsis sp. YSL2]